MFFKKRFAAASLPAEACLLRSGTAGPLWMLRNKGDILLLLPLFCCLLNNIFLLQIVKVVCKTGNIQRIDFVNFWTAARLALQGHILDLFNMPRFLYWQEQLLRHKFEWHVSILDHPLIRDWPPPFNWSYPPHLIPLILPLGFLSYRTALQVWLLTTFALYAAAVVPGHKKPLSLLLILATAPATLVNITLGQTGFFVGALLIGGVRLLDRRPILAGILLGFLTVKPQFCILLPFALLAQRAWKTILAACTTAALLVLLSVACFGIAPWIAFGEKTLLIQRHILEDPHPKVMMVTIFMTLRELGLSLKFCYAVNFLSGLLSIFCVLKAYASKAPADIKAAIFLTATFFATPYAFNYDLPVISAAIIFIWARRAKGNFKWPDDIVVLSAWLLPVMAVFLNIHNAPIAPVILLFFFMLQVIDLNKNTPGEPFLPAWTRRSLFRILQLRR